MLNFLVVGPYWCLVFLEKFLKVSTTKRLLHCFTATRPQLSVAWDPFLALQSLKGNYTRSKIDHIIKFGRAQCENNIWER